jgi:hypothetical protein
LGMLVFTSCKREVKEESVAEAPTTTVTTTRPTTQQLMSGPRQQLTLGALPLTAMVPQSWKMESLGNTEMLSGPAPVGEVQVIFSIRPRTTAEQMETIEAACKGMESEEPGQPIRISRMRSRDGMKLHEELKMDQVATTQPGKAVAAGSGIGTWRIRIFIPDGTRFRTYELNFIGMTSEMYAGDREFLRSIVDSIQIDASVLPQ